MKKSQTDRVIEMLTQAGGAGIHSFAMRQAFVGNPSQRIAEAEARGYVVTRKREKLQGAATGTRYTLVSQPAGAVRARHPEQPISPPTGLPGVAGSRTVPAEPSQLKATGSQSETAHESSALFEDPPARTYHDREAA